MNKKLEETLKKIMKKNPKMRVYVGEVVELNE